MHTYKCEVLADAAGVSLANAAVEHYAVELLRNANRIANVGKRSFVTSADVECAVSMSTWGYRVH